MTRTVRSSASSGAIDLLRPSFSAQLDALRAGADGYLFIVTSKGVMVHHPDKARILETSDDAPGSLLEAALRNDEGWEDGVLDEGVPVLLVHKRACARWTGSSVCLIRYAARFRPCSACVCAH
jgi:hypothetical protein